MSGPNFFVVGAPKCGTSTLYHWLRQRPDIYMPYDSGNRYWRHKEPYHFCPDLVNEPHRVGDDEYAEMFEPGADYPLRGEASAIYLFSEDAPRLIAEAAPDARIIICLRHPADFIVSKWRDCLYWGHDEELNFRKATDPDRPIGDLPEHCWYPAACAYKRLAHFSEFIPAFVDQFGEDRIHFVWLYYLRTAPAYTFGRILDFLGAEPVTDNFDYSPHNVTPGVRRTILTERAIRWRMERTEIGRRTYPLVEKGFSLFFKEDVSKTIPVGIRHRLRREYEDEFSRLLEMTGAAA